MASSSAVPLETKWMKRSLVAHANLAVDSERPLLRCSGRRWPFRPTAWSLGITVSSINLESLRQ
eukprot:683433-Pyramimonas_sp.AAC.1